MTICVPASDLAVVLVTAPSPEVATTLGRQVVEERLAACANVVPGLRSIYRWDGRVCDEPEALCIIKTRTSLVPALAARIAELHPYDVPEILSLRGDEVSAAYRDWVLAETLPAGTHPGSTPEQT